MSVLWMEIVSNPWRVGLTAYLVVGFVVVLIAGGPGFRQRTIPKGQLSDPQNLSSFLGLFAGFHPIGFAVAILLWPIWLLLVVLNR